MCPNSPSLNLLQDWFGFHNRIKFGLLMNYSNGVEAFRALLTKFFVKSFFISLSLNESFCWQVLSEEGLIVLFSYSRLIVFITFHNVFRIIFEFEFLQFLRALVLFLNGYANQKHEGWLQPSHCVNTKNTSFCQVNIVGHIDWIWESQKYIRALPKICQGVFCKKN